MEKVKYLLMISISAFLLACTPSTKDENNEGDQTNNIIDDRSMDDMSEAMDEQKAVAEIMSASGSQLQGTATFTSASDGKVDFKLTVENVTPGEHAVHLHEQGDCSAADASSAMGHWNPTNQEHGKRGTGAFHKGDIGNMTVGEDGKGTMDITVEGWSIGGNADSNILDKAVIIHTGADDFTSQPSGAAGDRIGCGVIVQE